MNTHRKTANIVCLTIFATLILGIYAFQGNQKNKVETDVVLEENLADGSARNGNDCPVSFFLSDIGRCDTEETISFLNASNVSIITVPVAWSQYEEARGDFNADEYDVLLDLYASAGFEFIFVLDGGGRPILNNTGEIVDYSIPDWVRDNSEVSCQIDFSGVESPSYGLSYIDGDGKAYYLNFCRKAIEHFGNRYKNNLVGFAPGIMSELEIKYPQEQYAWNDYSEDALNDFHTYLENKYVTVDNINLEFESDYKSIEEIEFPIINYNNSLTSGNLVDDVLYSDFMIYREDAIEEYITTFYQLVHKNGYKTISYFGQLLSPQDAIYALGVATRFGSDVDIAVVDFNFYNGYDNVYDSMIPSVLVNYLKNAGYDEVWAGLYVERIDYLKKNDFLQETIDYLCADGVADGFELGGMVECFLEKGMDAVPNLKFGTMEREASPQIAMCVSEWNFYKSHGETVEYYNYFIDSVVQMYKIVRFELGYTVNILCDDVVTTENLSTYDLVILPSQFYVDPNVRSEIEDYVAQGGKVIQDFRFGEWDYSGNNTGSWSDACFDIGARMALCEEIDMMAVNDDMGLYPKDIRVNVYFSMIPNAYSMASKDGDCNYLYKDNQNRYYGIYTDNSIVIGFQPQLGYKYAKTQTERETFVSIVDNAIKMMVGES